MVLKMKSSIEDIKNWITEEDVLKVMIAMELITEEDIDSIRETGNSINKTLSDSSN